jgi:hypothetical protein
VGGIDYGFGGRECRRPRRALGHVRRCGGRAAQQRALLLRVRAVGRRTEAGNDFAVGSISATSTPSCDVPLISPIAKAGMDDAGDDPGDWGNGKSGAML